MEGVGRYWADQCGSFQLRPADSYSGSSSSSNNTSGGSSAGDLAMWQTTTESPGVNGWGTELPHPRTILGNPTDASDRTVAVNVRLPPANKTTALSYSSSSSSSSAISVANAAATTSEQQRQQQQTQQQRQQTTATAGVTTATTATNYTFTYATGRIVAGGGEFAELVHTTWEEAQRQCIADGRCGAITVESTTNPPPSAPTQLDFWLTSRTTIDNPGDPWESYLLSPPRPVALPLTGSWAGVCARVAVAAGGVCLQVNGSNWQVRAISLRVWVRRSVCACVRRRRRVAVGVFVGGLYAMGCWKCRFACEDYDVVGGVEGKVVARALHVRVSMVKRCDYLPFLLRSCAIDLQLPVCLCVGIFSFGRALRCVALLCIALRWSFAFGIRWWRTAPRWSRTDYCPPASTWLSSGTPSS